MNQATYKSAIAGARRQWPKLTARAMRKINAAYALAGKIIADILRDGAIVAGALDFETQRNLDQAILEASADIGQAIREEVPNLMAEAASLFAAIEIEVMKDAMAGLSGKITIDGIEKLFTKVAERSVISSLNTAWGDGFTFWGRVPNVSRHFGDDIVNLVRAAIDQGRDLGKIAADVNKYIKDGKEATIHRWGERIAPDSAELLKRVPKQVDYRALRLARSELGRGLMETAKANGLANPAASGLWDWVRVNVIDWGCNCPSNAAHSPYTFDNIPVYDHPNCHPAGTMIMTPWGNVPIESIVPGDVVVSHDGSLNRVTAKWAEKYSGDMVIVQSDGRSISATPEHPLLTLNGWVPAHDLKSGGDISGVFRGVEPVTLVKDKSHDGPTFGNEKSSFFRILTCLSPGGMPVTAIDFNGELYIMESQVNTESADSKVWDGPFPNGFESLVHEAFILGPERALVKLGDLETVFVRLGRTSDSIMSGTGIERPSMLVGSTMSLGYARERNAKIGESSVDKKPGNTESLGYVVHRQILFNVKMPNKVIGNVGSLVHDRIVSVTLEKFNGVVHNLSVERKNSFIANGFASHNCQCIVRPRLKNQTDFQADLKAWINGGQNAELETWYQQYYLTT